MPPEIQYEIFANYKESLKAKRSESTECFPGESNDFSKYQMNALLHKSEISNKINNLKNSMKACYSSNYNSFLAI